MGIKGKCQSGQKCTYMYAFSNISIIILIIESNKSETVSICYRTVTLCIHDPRITAM